MSTSVNMVNICIDDILLAVLPTLLNNLNREPPNAMNAKANFMSISGDSQPRLQNISLYIILTTFFSFF